MSKSNQFIDRSDIALIAKYGFSALRRVHGRKSDQRHIILLYHRVIDSNKNHVMPEPGMWVDVNTFEKQIGYLQSVFRMVSLYELAAYLRDRIPINETFCAVTFDDGWRDNLTNALPVLEYYGVPATVYVVSGLVVNNNSFWADKCWNALMKIDGVTGKSHRLPECVSSCISRLKPGVSSAKRVAVAGECIKKMKLLPNHVRDEITDCLCEITGYIPRERPHLNRDEIISLSEKGIEIGSHTRNHGILTYLSREELLTEMIGSRLDLEKITGRRVVSFSYPNGDWDERVRECVVDAGYEYACTTQHGYCKNNSRLYTLPRIGMHEGISSFRGKYSEKALRTRLGIC